MAPGLPGLPEGRQSAAWLADDGLAIGSRGWRRWLALLLFLIREDITVSGSYMINIGVLKINLQSPLVDHSC